MDFNRKMFAVLDRFEFEHLPVAVKYLTQPPPQLELLDGKMALCEMLKLAQQGQPFYANAQSHACGAGAYVLGHAPIETPYLSGEFGAGLKLFDSPRSASRLYHYIPRIAQGVVGYTALAPLTKLTFDPDVLLCLCSTEQTELLLRAMSYRTGQMWSSRYSPAIGCAWLFVQPYLSGQLNYTITGLGHGMKRRHLFPPGRQFVAIPFDQLTTMLQTLEQMPWDLPGYQPDGMAYIQQLHADLGLG